MQITPKIDFVSGSFDTDNVKLLCVPSDNHGVVDLCVKEPDCAWNIPIGRVILHSNDLYKDFKETLSDATRLGDEISRRWNECPVWHKISSDERPADGDVCLLRFKVYVGEDSEGTTSYVTSVYRDGDFDLKSYLSRLEIGRFEITHWQKIVELEDEEE